MNLTPGDVRNLWIEKCRQCPQDAALGLSAQSKQNEVVPRKNRVDDLRHNRVIVANDSWKYGRVAVRAQTCYKIVAKFVFHPACA